MNRRAFLESMALGAAATMVGVRTEAEEDDPLAGVLIVDAHAHPDQFFGAHRSDRSSTLESIIGLGMAASSFSAIGDTQKTRGGPWQDETMHAVHLQLDVVHDLARAGKVRLIKRAADITMPSPGVPPGAILALEGAHPVGTKPDRVDELYGQGVRVITLMHYAESDLGDCMTCRSHRTGLTSDGRKILERMQRAGILVDVAHADSQTARQIVDRMDRPVIDSHTSLCPSRDSARCGRLRPWDDMETIARKGGIVCSWPLAYARQAHARQTFRDWAAELLEMTRRLGVAHVGIGTDGGGSLPASIQDYRDVRDLRPLARAMREVGFAKDEIAAVFGGNFCRVLQESVG